VGPARRGAHIPVTVCQGHGRDGTSEDPCPSFSSTATACMQMQADLMMSDASYLVRKMSSFQAGWCRSSRCQSDRVDAQLAQCLAVAVGYLITIHSVVMECLL
jgi:hypothetical protein